MPKADGSVIIDTRMDVKGIKTGVVDVNKQMDRMHVSAKGAAAAIKAGMSSGAVATAKLEAEVELLEEKIQALKQKAAEYGKQQIPTKEYEELRANIEKVNEQLNKLEERRARMKATGVSQESQAWKNVNYDISTARQQLSRYMQEKAQMESTGTAYVSGTGTNEYAEMQNSLAAANTRLAEMKSQLTSSNSFMSRLGKGAKSFLSTVGNAAKTIGGKLLSGIKAAASGIGSLVKKAGAMKKPFNGLGSSLKRLAPAMLATEGVMGILRKAVNAYMSENEQLSAKLNSLWSGIGNLLGPIITKIVNLIASAIAYLTQFLKLLGMTGDTASKSINKAGGNASKETKKLQKQLASFDEITTLGGKGSDSNGGGGTNATVADLPEVNMPDWVQMMIDKMKSGKWGEAAATLTGQMNNMIASVDWSKIGGKIGKHLNNALEFLTSAATTFDWAGIGKAIGDSFMGLWDAIDWANAGKGLGESVKGVINTISSTIKTINWKKIGTDVAKFIGGIDWSGIASALSDGIGAALGGLGALILGAVKKAWNSVTKWWKENAYKDGKFTMQGLLNGVWEGIKSIGTWIKEKVFTPFINGLKKAFGIHSPSTVMAEMGKYLIQGLLNGIKNAWKSITTYFSTTLTKIKTTIQNAWNAIKDSKTWATIKTNLSTTWDGLKSKASTAFNGIKSTVTTAWAAIRDSKTWGTIKSNLSTAWDGIKNTASTKFGGIKKTITDAWKKTMEGLSGGEINFSVIGDSIKDAFKTAINALIKGLNNAIGSPINKLNQAIMKLKYKKVFGTLPFQGLSVLPVPKIPYLAKGAVIPPNAPFMAMLGDQRHGTNIEAPLSTIQEAVALVLEDMTGGLMAGFEATVAVLREILEAILGIEIGDTVIAEAVNRYNRKMAVVKGG